MGESEFGETTRGPGQIGHGRGGETEHEGRESRRTTELVRDPHGRRQERHVAQHRPATVETRVSLHERAKRRGKLTPLLERYADLLRECLRTGRALRGILCEASVHEQRQLPWDGETE